MMDKTAIEKLFQGKVLSHDQQSVLIVLADSRKELSISIEEDVLALIEKHQDYALNIIKNLKKKSNQKITKEHININHRNYKIFI